MVSRLGIVGIPPLVIVVMLICTDPEKLSIALQVLPVRKIRQSSQDVCMIVEG